MLRTRVSQIGWDSLILDAVRRTTPVLFLLGAIVALIVRLQFFQVATSDYTYYLWPWYGTLEEMGFAAFRLAFYNHAPLYLYAIFILTALFPQVPALVGIKALSVTFNFVCAIVVAKMVDLKYRRTEHPLLAFWAVLFAPTVVLNGTYWGQADIVYTTALMISLYLLMTGRQIPALIAFGVAFSLKQ